MGESVVEAKPKRRWFQFHLWHLIVLMTVVAIGCAVYSSMIAEAMRAREMSRRISSAHESPTRIISECNEFLRAFPNHPNAGRTRVLRGVVMLRVRGTQDPSDAFRLAKEIVGEIRDEDAFSEFAADAGDVLLSIAEALAEEARDENDPSLAAEAREAADLVEEVIPEKRLQRRRLRELETQLDATQRPLGPR
jgi:hypothetical protein